MGLMRRLMTTVLLDTTNREFERIAEEQLGKEKLKGSTERNRRIRLTSNGIFTENCSEFSKLYPLDYVHIYDSRVQLNQRFWCKAQP